MARKLRIGLIGIVVFSLSVLAMPGKLAFADCRVTSTTNGSDDVVICRIDPPDTNGLYTAGGDDRITIEAGAEVSGAVSPEGDPTAIQTGSGSDTVYNYGTVRGTEDGIDLRTGAADVLHNYGSVIGADDGVWCSPQSGQSCTINNYGLIEAFKEAIDVYMNGARLVIYNEGTITSTDQEALHLIGSSTNDIINRGTIIGSHNGIEPLGGTTTIQNYGTIRSLRERGVDLDGHHDTVYNYGIIRGDRDPGIDLSSGRDRLYHYGTIEGYCYLDLGQSVIEAGPGDDYLLIKGTVSDLNSGFAAIEAGMGNDTVVIQGGLIDGDIHGDGDYGTEADKWDVLIFEFTGVQSEADAFHAQIASQSSENGAATWQNYRYTWKDFEEIRVNITVVPGTPAPTWTPTIPPTPTITPTPPPAFQPSSTIYEQTRSGFAYVGTWNSVQDTSASGDSYRQTRDVVGAVNFAFRGNKLTIYRTMNNIMGQMHVCIDGACRIVDNYSATPRYQVPEVFWVADPNAVHRVEVERIHVPNFYINLDGIRVEAVADAATPTTGPSPTTGATSTPAATLTPSSTPLPAGVLGEGLHQENHGYITLTGTWTNYGNASASGGRYSYTGDDNARVNFSFYGARMTLLRRLDTTRGEITVCVDGACQIVDNYSPTRQWQVPFTVDVALGQHDVEITNSGGRFTDFDAVRIEMTGSGSTPAPTNTLAPTVPPTATSIPSTAVPTNTSAPTSTAAPTTQPTATLTPLPSPTAAGCPPSAPAAVTARRHDPLNGSRTLTVEWEDVGADPCMGVTHYVIYASYGSYAQQWTANRADASCTGAICQLVIVIPDTVSRMYWRVEAYNALGTGGSDNLKRWDFSP